MTKFDWEFVRGSDGRLTVVDDEAGMGEKYNRNHDAKSRFAPGGGGGSGVTTFTPDRGVVVVGDGKDLEVPDEIWATEKFNRNHDARGRFAAGGGGGSGGAASPMTNEYGEKINPPAPVEGTEAAAVRAEILALPDKNRAELEAAHKEMMRLSSEIESSYAREVSPFKGIEYLDRDKAWRAGNIQRNRDLDAATKRYQDANLTRRSNDNLANRRARAVLLRGGSGRPFTEANGDLIMSTRGGINTVQANRAGDFVGRMAAPPVRDRMPKLFVTSSSTGRSFYRSSESSINMAKGANVDVYAHEMGHHVDSSIQAGPRSRNFIARRNRSPDLQPLNAISSGYGRDEVAIRDDFTNPYSGKVYTDGSSETISMGLQHMHNDPIKFAREDPDFFDFTYNTMRDIPDRDTP